MWIARPLHHRVRVPTMLLPLLILLGGAGGCSDPLMVNDPTLITDDDLNNAEGAELLRRYALAHFYGALSGAAFFSGMLADEIFRETAGEDYPGAGAPDLHSLLDRRESEENVQLWQSVPSYGALQTVRLLAVPAALAKLRSYARPGAREAHVGEILALRGYAEMRLAEDFCPGFPLHDVVDFRLFHGPPHSTEQAFERALTSFDSAATVSADSARVLNFARVGRARTLLGLGRLAEAGSAAAAVPTDYVAEAEYNEASGVFQSNDLGISDLSWWIAHSQVGSSVADDEGGNGMDFVSANDPRVVTIRVGTARDDTTGIYGIAKYPDREAPMVLASGVEARLIEAEAALNANDANWLTILNQLRATQISPPLHPLADPGTADARVDLLFRERAFWLFATGHRLGDLRRLLRHYGRASETVFPSGVYRQGGVYGSATSMPFDVPQEVATSPSVTGCTR